MKYLLSLFFIIGVYVLIVSAVHPVYANICGGGNLLIGHGRYSCKDPGGNSCGTCGQPGSNCTYQFVPGSCSYSPAISESCQGMCLSACPGVNGYNPWACVQGSCSEVVGPTEDPSCSGGGGAEQCQTQLTCDNFVIIGGGQRQTGVQISSGPVPTINIVQGEMLQVQSNIYPGCQYWTRASYNWGDGTQCKDLAVFWGVRPNVTAENIFFCDRGVAKVAYYDSSGMATPIPRPTPGNHLTYLCHLGPDDPYEPNNHNLYYDLESYRPPATPNCDCTADGTTNKCSTLANDGRTTKRFDNPGQYIVTNTANTKGDGPPGSNAGCWIQVNVVTPTPIATNTPTPTPTLPATPTPWPFHLNASARQLNCGNNSIYLSRYVLNIKPGVFQDVAPAQYLNTNQVYTTNFNNYVCTAGTWYQTYIEYTQNGGPLQQQYSAIECESYDTITVTCPTATNTPVPPTSPPVPTSTPGAWVKLNTSSFTKRVPNGINNPTGYINRIPAVISPFDNTGDDNTTRVFINNKTFPLQKDPGVAIANNSDFGGASISSKGWLINDLKGTVDIQNFIKYAKSRKDYNVTDTNLTNIAANKINIISSGNLIIDNAKATSIVSVSNGNPLVLIVDGGDISFANDVTIFNAPKYPIVLMASNTNQSATLMFFLSGISPTVSEANGVFIADKIDTGIDGNMGLKIDGNIITDLFSNGRSRMLSSNLAPSVLITQDLDMYMKILPLMSNSIYEWDQLK
jgi:hypothetical protein